MRFGETITITLYSKMFLLQIVQAYYPDIIIGIYDELDAAIAVGKGLIAYNPEYSHPGDCIEFLRILYIAHNCCDEKKNIARANGELSQATVWHSCEVYTDLDLHC